MLKVFVLFMVSVMVFLVFLGMSGFVSELMVFVGLIIMDIYSFIFCIVMVFLVVVGLILIFIYLFFMLC